MFSRSLALVLAPILAALFVPVGCVISPEQLDPAADAPAAMTQDNGPPACSAGSVCFVTPTGSMTQQQGVCAASPSGGYVCCIGCVDARGNCQSGTSGSVCGQSGASCLDCNDGNDCTNDFCGGGSGGFGGTCQHAALDHTHACMRTLPGYCNGLLKECCTTYDLTCCKGCVDNGVCLSACPAGKTCDPITVTCY